MTKQVIKNDHLKTNTNYTLQELKKISEEAKKSYNFFRKYVLVVAGHDVKSQIRAIEKATEICVLTN